MLLSLCTEYYQIFLCQGIGIGLGFGFLMNLTVGVPAQWFRRRRAVAMGVVSESVGINVKQTHSHNVLFCSNLDGERQLARWYHLSDRRGSPLCRSWLPMGHENHWLHPSFLLGRGSTGELFGLPTSLGRLQGQADTPAPIGFRRCGRDFPRTKMQSVSTVSRTCSTFASFSRFLLCEFLSVSTDRLKRNLKDVPASITVPFTPSELF